jgi:hypothetical protein
MAFFTKSEARAAAGRARGFRSNSAVLKESMESYKGTDRFDMVIHPFLIDAKSRRLRY